MKNNKGSLALILGLILAVSLLGGGAMYYKNKTTTDQGSEGGSKNDISKILDMSKDMSPKEIFLKKNTELFNAKSFDEMLKINMKYSSASKITEDEADLKYVTTDEKKQAFFSFAQVMLVPTEQLTDVVEEITGDTAKVTAYDQKSQQHVSTYIKENGVWKESDNRVLLNPKPRK